MLSQELVEYEVDSLHEFGLHFMWDDQQWNNKKVYKQYLKNGYYKIL